MIKRFYRIDGIIAFAAILTFWSSTVAVELLGSREAIASVKRAIPWGFLLLVPALAVTGASGFQMAGPSSDRRIAGKKRRMRFIAANGLLILAPSAFYLAFLAARGNFGILFYSVQSIELVAGAVNLTLMGLNFRDGLRLTGRLSAQGERELSF
jgi:hypothetical protein